MTYLVMECHPAYAVVLDQAGRMMKVANLGYEEGQQIEHVVEQQVPATPLRIRFASAAMAACLCVAVLGGGFYGAFFTAYGSVRLRINPDVRLSVSYMDRVVGLEGMNDDGAHLIEQVDYQGKNAEEMTQILVERAVDLGYLSDGGAVTVWADAGSSNWKEKRESAIRSGLERQLEGRMTVEIKSGAPETEADDASEAERHSGADKPYHSSDARPAAITVPASENHPVKPADGSESLRPGGEDDDWEDDEEDDRNNDDDDADNGRGDRNRDRDEDGDEDDDRKNGDRDEGDDRRDRDGDEDDDVRDGDEDDDKEDSDEDDDKGDDDDAEGGGRDDRDENYDREDQPDESGQVAGSPVRHRVIEAGGENNGRNAGPGVNHGVMEEPEDKEDRDSSDRESGGDQDYEDREEVHEDQDDDQNDERENGDDDEDGQDDEDSGDDD